MVNFNKKFVNRQNNNDLKCATLERQILSSPFATATACRLTFGVDDLADCPEQTQGGVSAANGRRRLLPRRRLQTGLLWRRRRRLGRLTLAGLV